MVLACPAATAGPAAEPTDPRWDALAAGALLVVLRIKESVRRRLHKASQQLSTPTGSRPMPKSKAVPGVSGVGS